MIKIINLQQPLLNFITNLVVNFYIYKYTSEKLLAFIFATLAGMSVNFLGQNFFVFK